MCFSLTLSLTLIHKVNACLALFYLNLFSFCILKQCKYAPISILESQNKKKTLTWFITSYQTLFSYVMFWKLIISQGNIFTQLNARTNWVFNVKCKWQKTTTFFPSLHLMEIIILGIKYKTTRTLWIFKTLTWCEMMYKLKGRKIKIKDCQSILD